MALKIHFLNVGHGDCTIIEHPTGRLTMIDINNSKSLPEEDKRALAAHQGLSVWEFETKRLIEGRSWAEYYESLLVDPADYFSEHFSDRSVFRYVQTHPDMDHMGGLHRFFWQDRVGLENFWDVAHSKVKKEEDFNNSPHSYIDWLVYELLRTGCGPGEDSSSAVANAHKVIHNLRGHEGDFWTRDHVEVLSPTTDLIASCNKSDNYNNCSYVLKITHAGRTVILPGDAESAAWHSILDNPGPGAIACDILKAAHHGRESGYDKEAVDAMSPEVVICSVGKKPDTDASDEYRRHGAEVFSTRYQGTMVVTIWDDGDVWIENHKGDRIYTIS